MSATQTVDGVEVPVAGTWSVDPGHTEVGFVGRHLGLTKTRGRFTGVDGTVRIADDPTASTIDITIDMASVESGSTKRDDSLRSANYFDVDNHPTARFRSTSVTIDGTGGTVTGDLTIKGVNRPVVLDVDYLGYVRDPWGNDRAAFGRDGHDQPRGLGRHQQHGTRQRSSARVQAHPARDRTRAHPPGHLACVERSLSVVVMKVAGERDDQLVDPQAAVVGACARPRFDVTSG